MEFARPPDRRSDQIAPAVTSRAELARVSLSRYASGWDLSAFAQFYRFAAGEVAEAAFRPLAISLVLGSGIVAALAGPMLARLGGPLLEPQYVGSFLLLAVVLSIGVESGTGIDALEWQLAELKDQS